MWKEKSIFTENRVARLMCMLWFIKRRIVLYLSSTLKQENLNFSSWREYTSLEFLVKPYIIADNAMTRGSLVLFCVPGNVALHKPARQSSTYHYNGLYFIAALAVDGDNSPTLFRNHCSCTSPTYEPWWAVDLQNRYTLLNISLTNRDINGTLVRFIDETDHISKCIHVLHETHWYNFPTAILMTN